MNTVGFVVENSIANWAAVAMRRGEPPTLVGGGKIRLAVAATSLVASSMARKLLDEAGAVLAVVRGDKADPVVAMLVTACRARAVNVSVVDSKWVPPAGVTEIIPAIAPSAVKLAIWAARSRGAAVSRTHDPVKYSIKNITDATWSA